MEKKNGEILPLTGLRFAAALYVFLFHMHLRWPFSHGFVTQVIGEGAVGMSVFFLLSGFVLAYRYAGNLEVREYFLHRFARIYPMYAAVAIATLPWLGISLARGLHEHIVGGQAAFLISTNILLIQAWFPQLFSLWNDGGSWSISVEAFCYALFPLLLPYFISMSRRAAFGALCVFYLLGALPGISAYLFGDYNPLIFYMLPIFRLPEFIIGMCVFVIYRSGWKFPCPAWLQTAALLLIIFYFGYYADRMPFFIGHDWIFLPFVAFMVLSLAAGGGFWAALLSTRLAHWLGKISYSFYSCQSLFLLLLIKYHDALVQQIPVLQNNAVLLAASFLTLLGFATTGYYLIEAPARIWITRKYGHQKPLVV